MAWWDDLLSFGTKVYEAAKPVAETAWNFAKENPTVTGAGLGLLTGGGTGDYGSNNFRNALVGGAAGYTAGQMFGGNTSAPSQVAAGMTPQTPQAGGQDGITQWIAGNADKVGTASAAGAANYSAPTAFGAGVGDMWDSAKTGVSKLQEFGSDKKNRTLLEMGMKGVGSFMDYQQGKANEELAKQYADQEMRGNAANEARVNARNAAENDVYANQKALIGSVGQNEVASQNAATKRAIAGIQKQSGLSAGAKEALSRSTGVQGSQAAGTRGATATLNATAGLRAPTYAMSGSPNNGAAVNYSQLARDNTRTVAKNLNKFGSELFGWEEDAKKQVNGAT